MVCISLAFRNTYSTTSKRTGRDPTEVQPIPFEHHTFAIRYWPIAADDRESTRCKQRDEEIQFTLDVCLKNADRLVSEIDSTFSALQYLGRDLKRSLDVSSSSDIDRELKDMASSVESVRDSLDRAKKSYEVNKSSCLWVSTCWRLVLGERSASRSHRTHLEQSEDIHPSKATRTQSRHG